MYHMDLQNLNINKTRACKVNHKNLDMWNKCKLGTQVLFTLLILVKCAYPVFDVAKFSDMLFLHSLSPQITKIL